MLWYLIQIYLTTILFWISSGKKKNHGWAQCFLLGVFLLWSTIVRLADLLTWQEGTLGFMFCCPRVALWNGFSHQWLNGTLKSRYFPCNVLSIDDKNSTAKYRLFYFIFYQKGETKGQSVGLAEGSIHPHSGRKPVHLLRIISCSKACKVPGSYILLYNTWMRLLFQYVKRWSDALRHLSKQYVFRSYRWICRLFCIKVFFFSSFSWKQHLVLCTYLEDLTREAYFSDSSCFDIVTSLFCFPFCANHNHKDDVTLPVHKSVFQYRVWPCC